MKLQNPKKEGSKFLGWYSEGQQVTEINENQIKDLSYQNLSKMLSNRRLGPIELEAKWDTEPEIYVKDVYGYLLDTNSLDRVMKEVVVIDKEDGDISEKAIWLNRKDVQEKVAKYSARTFSKNKEYTFPIYYEVEDSSNQIVKATAKLHLYAIGEQEVRKNSYRYISKEYIHTLDKKSIWRNPINLSRLKEMLEE